MPLSPGSSHSHMSPNAKSLSTSPNFNTFSPLSPFQAKRELEDDDPDSQSVEPHFNTDLSSEDRIVYRRNALLKVGRTRPLSSWPKPKDMAPLHEWFGNAHPSHKPMDDPAIASMGQGSGRKAAGYGEGFGFGGGIGGGRGLGRGARPAAGNVHNDARTRRHDLDANGLPVHNKDAFTGQMGKFSVKVPGERLRAGGNDEVRGTREDWRRGGPPQPPRQDRRQWVNHQEETSQPAWMDDEAEVDPAIVVERDQTPFSFAGNDLIAAHKRMMKGAGESRQAEPLVPFFAGQGVPSAKTAKAPKQVNVSDYLLPGKGSAKASPVSPQVDPPPVASHSRFQRFFGPPQPGLPTSVHTSDRQAPETTVAAPVPNHQTMASQPSVTSSAAHLPPVQSPPPLGRNQAAAQTTQMPAQDHASRLMGMLKSPPPSNSTSSSHQQRHVPQQQSQQPQPYPQDQQQQYSNPTSPPPGMPFTRASYTSPPPIPGGMMNLFDHRSPEYSRNYGPPPPPPSFPSHFSGHYPNPPQGYNPPPGLLPSSTQAPQYPPVHHHGSLPPHAMTQHMHRPGYPYGPPPGTLPPPLGPHAPPPMPQLGMQPQDMLTSLYGNIHQGHS